MSDDVAKLQLQLDEARAFQRLTSSALNDELARSKFDLVAHLERQRQFSEQTFGPGDASDRFAGLSIHIKKELLELEREPMCLEEWIDVVLLGLDGAWRTGASSAEIAKALEAKQAKNEKREWPDWRTVPKGTAIEHVRPHGFTEADYVAQVERLTRGLELARAERNALAAEVERLRSDMDAETARLRTKASDDWDLALRERDRAVELRDAMALDVLAGLAAAGIATPVEGYVKASWAVSGDIARLAKERDEARAEVESYKRLADTLAFQRDEARAEVEQLSDALAPTEREVIGLRAEVERLRAEHAKRHDELTKALAEIDELHLARRERDEARAEVARYKRLADTLAFQRDEAKRKEAEMWLRFGAASEEVERLIEDAEDYVADADLCANCRDEVSAIGHSLRGEVTHRARCATADPKPTPPVDVPNVTRQVKSTLTKESLRAALTEAYGEDGLREMARAVDPILRRDSTADDPFPASAAAAVREWIVGPRSPADLTGERPTPPERPRAKHVEQPAPTGNGVEVFRVAIAECPSESLAEALKAREAIGIERYGTTLRTHNGRDVVRDLREELADAFVYATQAHMEQSEPESMYLLRSVRWYLVDAWRVLDVFVARRAPVAHEASPAAASTTAEVNHG